MSENPLSFSTNIFSRSLIFFLSSVFGKIALNTCAVYSLEAKIEKIVKCVKKRGRKNCEAAAASTTR